METNEELSNKETNLDAFLAYRDLFQDSPPSFGLNAEKTKLLVQICNEAVKKRQRVRDWPKALNIPPLKEGQLT